MLIKSEKTLAVAASKAGMDEKTARRYRDLKLLPSEVAMPHTWRTRADVFADVWDELEAMLQGAPGLEAKTLFEYLQRTHPGKYADGQLRTLQRKVKAWRVSHGPGKEVFFPQIHYPGLLSASDFTHMDDLGVTIGRKRFDHLVYHFVLTYSNWETGTVCFSESFESLCEGFQNALWELGSVPKSHRTDQLTAAVVRDLGTGAGFTDRYESMLRHYGLKGERTQPSSPNENGDCEQSHHRFKRCVEQTLLLRGNREFSSRADYEGFLRSVFAQKNSGREARLREETDLMGRLPHRRLESHKVVRVKVGPSSTIHVAHNTYSVSSRLIGESVEVRLSADHLSVHHGQRCVESHIPRLRGEGRHAINYRHVIDWLVRKPGAFENYRYHQDLFPTSRFRIAYDSLGAQGESRPQKQYLRILELAARESETAVDEALRRLLDQALPISFAAVQTMVSADQTLTAPTDVVIDQVDLSSYDSLFVAREAAL